MKIRKKQISGMVLGISAIQFEINQSSYRHSESDISTMSTLTYTNPRTGLDRKRSKRAWGTYIAMFLTGPVTFALLAWGVYLGFFMQENAQSVMTVALAVAIVFMSVKMFACQPLSDHVDEVVAQDNKIMWSNVHGDLVAKYGEGTVSPVDAEPSIISPPDGARGFWSWVEEKLFSKDVKVLWIPEGEEPQRKMLSVSSETYEPILKDMPQRTPVKKKKKAKK